MNNDPASPATPTARRVEKYAPLVLSALVYPGAGQLAQRRWISAGVFMVLATGCAGLLFYYLLAGLVDITRALLASATEPPGVAWGAIGAWFLAFILTYAANIADVLIAGRRRAAAAKVLRP